MVRLAPNFEDNLEFTNVLKEQSKPVPEKIHTNRSGLPYISPTMCSELATYELNAAKRKVVMAVYRRNVRLPMIFRIESLIVFRSRAIRRSGGNDSSIRKDQRKTAVAMIGGARNTHCHDAI